MNPNTGEEIDEWGCAITWLPMMQIETSQQARQAGAAVESFRNEVVRTNSQNQQLYIEHMKKKVTFPREATDLYNFFKSTGYESVCKLFFYYFFYFLLTVF